ncbi:hypothetical protein DYB25_013269 [Aphanomyces astaci]|uniref:DDE-1 domain-containing protein n=1 Tax=Aphanomyces astaci TaxID=112090 RepID=A0A397AD56_APHAT|nr:hypothetical protein DYB25_013269 [Aphanomyces astaci]RHY45499.1 hypothetical protein DYB30_012218 [Aphanomyces astaci]RHY59793.1 hypothetical protein DYB38_004236 [Aphanomyces astaci]RHZ34973.1 hypothetical protein DYB31_014668 [Aphanomyces astaci]
MDGWRGMETVPVERVAERIVGQSLLVLDNFDSHISKEGVDTTAEIGFDVCPLPPNATFYCQPLDVSIVAPFKRHLRDLWITEDMVSHGDDDGDENWMSPAAYVKRTTIIKRTIDAWEKTTPGRFVAGSSKRFQIRSRSAWDGFRHPKHPQTVFS